MPKRINWRLVRSNLKEAREELERLELETASPSRTTKYTLEHGLIHAYHHLNVAWRARHVPDRVFSTLSRSQFNSWGRFPMDIELLALDRPPPRHKKGRGV